MDVVRCALIGAAGGMSKLRGNAVLENERARVTVACVRKAEKRPPIEEKYGVPIVPDHLDATGRDDVDAVIISTLNPVHFPIAKAALERGKHVLIEYPMTVSLEEYDELRRLADERGLILQDGLTPLREDYFLAVRDMLPAIGRTLSCQYHYHLGRGGAWYWKETVSGDFFVLVHIHQLAHLWGWFGDLECLWAIDTGVPFEDGEVRASPTLLKFRSGSSAVLEIASGLAASGPYSFEAVGTDGLLQMAHGPQGMEVSVRKTRNEEPQTRAVKMDFQKWVTEDTNEFLNAVLDGGPQLVTPEVGRKILHYACLASESARSGKIEYVG